MSLSETIAHAFRHLFSVPALSSAEAPEPRIPEGTWMSIVPELPIDGGSPVVVFFPMSTTMRLEVCRGLWTECSGGGLVWVEDSGEYLTLPEGAVMRVDLSTTHGMGNSIDRLFGIWEGQGPQTDALHAYGFHPHRFLYYDREDSRCMVAQMLRVVAEV